MNLRVLQVLGYPDGGAAASVVDLALSLARDRCEVTVASPPLAPKVGEQLRVAGVDWVEVPLAGRRDHASFRRIRAEVRQRSIDVVHTHCRNADLIGGLAASSVKVPWVSHLRGLFRDARGNDASSWVDQLHRMTLRRAPARLFAVSQAVRQRSLDLLGLPPSRVVHAPHGIDLGQYLHSSSARPAGVRRQLGLAPQDYAVLSVGSIGRCKGQDVLLDALGQLNSSRRPRWIVVGDGPDREELEAVAARSRVEVSFLGHSDEVPSLLRACDLFVHPARWEGFGRVVVEAMAAGCPVVASGVDGIKEVIEHEHSGLLVPADDPKALAAAIGRMQADPSLARRLRATARLRAQTRFGAEKGHQIIRRVLAEVCSTTTRSAVS